MIRSITETPNPLTRNLDVAEPVGIIRLLRQADAQIFAGYESYPCILDEEVLESLAKVAWQFSRAMLEPDSIIVLSGAGTSGRLAHLLSMSFNAQLREHRMEEIFVPLIAGGEGALIQALEAAEDSASAAVKDFKDLLTRDIRRGIYVGITAGLSAPYVAAQLDLIGGNAKFESVLVAFNPASMARDRKISGWDETVKSVVDHAIESSRFTLLNPIYGPEALTGSTRMKGGTTTKILLQTAFVTALTVARMEMAGAGGPISELSADNLLPLRLPILDQLQRYRSTLEAAYGNVPGLAELVKLAGSALRSGGRIYYVGRGAAGLTAIIDASECPPTFGADLFDVRGYVFEGWELLGFNSAQMKARGKAYEIGHDYFEHVVLPDLSKGDLVLGVCVQSLGDNSSRLLEAAAERRATTAVLMVGSGEMRVANLPASVRQVCQIQLPSNGYAPGVTDEAELALKVCLNAITTGAYSLAGKIYRNQLIDLKISNSKLHERATDLIAQLLGIPDEDAFAALQYAIFKEKQSGNEDRVAAVAKAVQRGASRSRIVPLALLLATGLYDYDEAEKKLANEPRVRRLVEEVSGGGTSAD